MQLTAAFVIFIAVAQSNSPGYSAYAQANALFVAKKFPESLAVLDEALKLDGRLVPALTLHAKMAMTLNRFDVARQDLEIALAVSPASGYARFLYGLNFYLSNDLQKAEPEFEKARLANPKDARSVLYLGLTRESLGQTTEAMSLYEEAVRLELLAEAPQAETYLTGAKLLHREDRLEDCRRWTDRAISLDPKLRDAHFELARLLVQTGDLTGAAKEGERALTLHGGNVSDMQIHYLLIRAYRADPAQASRHADTVRALEKSRHP